MILETVIFPFLISAAPATIPECVRPKDMGNPTLVRGFMACQDKKAKLCRVPSNSALKACTPPRPVVDYRKRYPENIVDITPSERCRITKEGAYVCEQDPIRFIVKDEPKAAPPQPDTGIKPVPAGSPGQTGPGVTVPDVPSAPPSQPSAPEKSSPFEEVPGGAQQPPPGPQE